MQKQNRRIGGSQRDRLIAFYASQGDIKALKRLGVSAGSIKKAAQKKEKEQKKKILEAKRALAIQYGWLEPKQEPIALPASRSSNFYGTSKPKDVKKMVIAVQGRAEVPAGTSFNTTSLSEEQAEAVRIASLSLEGRKLVDGFLTAKAAGKLSQFIKEKRLALQNAGLEALIAGVNSRAGDIKGKKRRPRSTKKWGKLPPTVETGLVPVETVETAAALAEQLVLGSIASRQAKASAKRIARLRKRNKTVWQPQPGWLKDQKRQEKLRERKAVRLAEYQETLRARKRAEAPKFLKTVDSAFVAVVTIIFLGAAVVGRWLLAAANAIFKASAVEAKLKGVRNIAINKRRGGGVPPTSETNLRPYHRPWQIRAWCALVKRHHVHCTTKKNLLSRAASACKKFVKWLFGSKKQVSKRRIDLQFFAEKPEQKIAIETVNGVEVVKTSFVKDTVEHSVVIPRTLGIRRTKEGVYQGISTEELLLLKFVPYKPEKVTEETRKFLAGLGTDLLALKGEGNLTVYVPYDPKAPITDIHCAKGPTEIKYFCGFEQQTPAVNEQELDYRLTMEELLEYKRIATAMKNEIGLATTAAVQMVSTLLVELPKKEKIPMETILALMRILELWELQPLQDKSAPQTLFTTSLAKELLKVPERPESLSEAIAVKQKNNKQQKSESESSNNGYKKSEKEKQKAFCNSVIKVLKTSNASDEPVSFTAIRLLLSVLVSNP